jgi:O-antigen ligase
LYKNTSKEEMFRWLIFYVVAAIFLSTIGRARLWGLGFFSIDTLMQEQFNSTPFFYLALLLPMAKFSKYLILLISIFSFSNTAYIGMFLGSFALREGSRKIKGVFYIGALALVVTLLYVDMEKILKNTLFYGKEGVGIEYTSGRDKIFDMALGAIQEKPLTGYGFVAGEAYIISKQRPGVIGAHNGLVSAMMGMGVLGVLLFILFFIRTLWFVKKATIPPLVKSAFLGTIILISVHTLGNPGIGSRVYGTWMPAMVAITFIVGFCYVLQKEAELTAYQNQAQ